jgi:hypothetical protein
MDPNVRYDPTSMGLDYNIDDTWANVSQDMKLDEWDRFTEQGFGILFRHTNLTAEQWRDPSKTKRTWPDPPIARRSWSLDAHLGVHAGNTFNVTIGSVQPGSGYEGATIGQMAAADEAQNVPKGNPTELNINGTKADMRYIPNVKDGAIIGSPTWAGTVDSYAFKTLGANTYLKPPGPTDRYNGLNYGLRHEIVGSLRHVYEPHFISTPFPDGLTLLREGIDTTRVTYAGIDTSNIPLSGGASRMIYANGRAEKRDFGVSQTMKVPTGGIGGNPFWLKDTKEWPSILRSLHFDFMPFIWSRRPRRVPSTAASGTRCTRRHFSAGRRLRSCSTITASSTRSIIGW